MKRMNLSNGRGDWLSGASLGSYIGGAFREELNAARASLTRGKSNQSSTAEKCLQPAALIRRDARMDIAQATVNWGEALGQHTEIRLDSVHRFKSRIPPEPNIYFICFQACAKRMSIAVRAMKAVVTMTKRTEAWTQSHTHSAYYQC